MSPWTVHFESGSFNLTESQVGCLFVVDDDDRDRHHLFFLRRLEIEAKVDGQIRGKCQTQNWTILGQSGRSKQIEDPKND